jgi:hypothetical protein
MGVLRWDAEHHECDRVMQGHSDMGEYACRLMRVFISLMIAASISR